MGISNYTVKRWLDLICLTTIAFIICLALHPLFQIGSQRLSEILTFWPFWIQYLIISLLTGLLWFIIIRLGGFRPSDLFSKVSIRYPPTWIFGLLGALIYIPISSNSITSEERLSVAINARELGIAGSAIFVGLSIASLLNTVFLSSKKKSLNCKRHPSNGNNAELKSLIDNDRELLLWLEQEEPIKYPSQDRFGLSCIARRISRELLSELRTVGVIGPYGVGKSSLFNLIEYYLTCKKELIGSEHCARAVQESRRIIFCRIDGWGRYKGSVAQQILTIAINRLSNEMDCLSILTVPANYRASLSASKGSLTSILSALLHTDEEPSKTLERLDKLLKTANIQFIFLLEDFDRSISDEMILDELPALLDRLYSLGNISFVLAISTERPNYYANILTRICDHVESLT